jgi:hypothetical protein
MSQPNIIITNKKIQSDQLKLLCQRWFGDMVKIVVDIERKWIGVGGELHPDAEELLIENGSRSADIWGVNLYPWHIPKHRIEYTALINIRPWQENPSLEIQKNAIRRTVLEIVESLVLGPDEELV